MSEARLILTCGLPGTGKSTLAGQLAVDLSALRLTKDERLCAFGPTPTQNKVEHELWQRIDERNSQPPWDDQPIRRADLDGWPPLFQAPGAAELALLDSLRESNRAASWTASVMGSCGQRLPRYSTEQNA